MPTVAEVGNNFNLPQYHGRLHLIGDQDYPLTTVVMNMAREFQGGGEVAIGRHRTFEWQFQEMFDRAQRTVVDGSDAPPPQHQSKTSEYNVIQTQTHAVELAWEYLGQTEQFAGQNIGQGPNPVQRPLVEQIKLGWMKLRGDIEYSAINGVRVLPGTNGTAGQTGGILPNITSNVKSCAESTQAVTFANATDTFTLNDHGLDNGDPVKVGGTAVPAGFTAGTVYYVIGATANTFQLSATVGGSAVNGTNDGTAVTVKRLRPLSTILLEDGMALAWDNFGLRVGDQRFLLTNLVHCRQLTAEARQAGLAVRSDTKFGVRIDIIKTAVGDLNLLPSRDVAVGQAAAVSGEQLRPWHRLIPDKGISFAKPLPIAGAREGVLLYTSFGLEWGDERKHVRYDDISPLAPTS